MMFYSAGPFYKERVKLKNGQKEKRSIEVEVKPPLYASVCAGCNKPFKMKEKVWGRDKLGKLIGVLDLDNPQTAYNPHNFTIPCCSFRCADILINGGWKKIPKYSDIAAKGYRLIASSLYVSEVVGPDKLIHEWVHKNHEEKVLK